MQNLQNEKTISFNTKTPAISKLRYWTRQNTVQEQFVSSTPKTAHTIILKYLERGKKYSYQLLIPADVEIVSPIYTFETE